MKKETKDWVFVVVVFIIATIWFLFVFVFPSKGDEIFVISQPPGFDEFERWFGPAPKGNERTRQLFDAKKLLLVEMEINPRDLETAAQTIRCKLTPDQWQDVLSVAFSYRIWQEICQVRKDLSMQKPTPGVTKDELIAEINRLEYSLKTELQKILDGQEKADKKLEEILKALQGLAGKLDNQSSQLREISNKLDRLSEDMAQPKSAPGVPQEEVDRMRADYEKKIGELSARIAELERQLAEARLVPWPEEEEKKEPGNFWVVANIFEQRTIYTNPFGFVGDSVVYHTWPKVASLIEIGARKFLVNGIVAGQIFASGGLHKTFIGGVGILVYVEPLDISLGVGAVYLSENLIGQLEPIQFFCELTHEGDWTRMSLRVVPQLNLAQLSAGVKF